MISIVVHFNGIKLLMISIIVHCIAYDKHRYALTALLMISILVHCIAYDKHRCAMHCL